MSATQTNRNPDLARLEAEGYRLQLVHGAANHILVSGIPAVTAQKTVVRGTLYSPLELTADGSSASPVKKHQCWWIGEAPCDATGRVMDELVHSVVVEDKGDGIKTDVSFSRKREDKSDYPDHYEKIVSYVELIWHQALIIDPDCDPRADRPIPAVVQAQKRAFKYPDMATTRAGIGAATAKLIVERVGLIGVGGTGSYILDLLAKVPIGEIHIYDGDDFELGNAFRSPGAPSRTDLIAEDGKAKILKKVDWFGDIYDRMKNNIQRHPYHVMAENISELQGFDFVFVAIDDPAGRKIILEHLIALKVPFIDVGLDIGFDPSGALGGMMRVTVGTPEKHDHISSAVNFAEIPPDEVYQNIQIADQNMLNAALAVSKWKKLRSFYADKAKEHNLLYTLETQSLIKEDKI